MAGSIVLERERPQVRRIKRRESKPQPENPLPPDFNERVQAFIEHHLRLLRPGREIDLVPTGERGGTEKDVLSLVDENGILREATIIRRDDWTYVSLAVSASRTGGKRTEADGKFDGSKWSDPDSRISYRHNSGFPLPNVVAETVDKKEILREPTKTECLDFSEQTFGTKPVDTK